jgi:hypothetical protein
MSGVMAANTPANAVRTLAVKERRAAACISRARSAQPRYSFRPVVIMMNPD